MAAQIKVAVCGALGRMGQTVTSIILGRPDMLLAGAVEHPACPALGREIGAAEAPVILAGSLGQGAGKADVYIDFTSVESSLAYLDEAVQLKLAAVIGTTGLGAAEHKKLEAAAKHIPVLWAPNMSVGVNAMFKMAAIMTKMLGPEYDIEIMEAHHHHKKDAPSGTALKLHDVVARARNLDPAKTLLTGRTGQVGERTRDEIAVLALRGGDIVGDHTVYFCGPGERLELTHRAQTRDTFAQGAVRAAAWLAGKKPGLYSIDDTISFDL
ncbi:MAG: 4-hydroxy-tetrahydrodipicolinate reductase [Candidatus Adiutrix sp.]|jgi:4-hydroxy-tetrahydrodipicolinate reductase|nr:4-hydroxy-tetrahydrodipicolinate reductase [Candidatus Adiutrix sp.]